MSEPENKYKSYAEKREDPRWQNRRLEILKRDGNKCFDCEKIPGYKEVHHSAYTRDPWDAPDNVLLTLCRNCHQARQKIEDHAHLMLGQIMARLRHHPPEHQDLLWFVRSLAEAVASGSTPMVVDSKMWDALVAQSRDGHP